MNMTVFLFFRTVHIFSAVLWVGSAIFYLFFVEPTIKLIGAAGQQFMQNLVVRRKYPLYMNTVALLTILSGVVLFYYDSGGFNLRWVNTGPGLGFTIGSLVGIAVFFVGALMIKPRGERIAALGKEIGKAGGLPSPAQAAELQRLDREINRVERVDFVLLTVALLTMVTARFWSF